ncbi:MAG: PAS domain S-box protein [Candidatus Cloacimonetes bacterium]|nr:PAS domain S-box protein [Candidatus Cloacimonadota bacterium]
MEFINRNLIDAGYEHQACTKDKAVAWGVINDQAIDIFIYDISTAFKLEDIDLLRFARDKTEAAIILTCDTCDNEVLERATVENVCCILEKPFSTSDFLTALEIAQFKEKLLLKTINAISEMLIITNEKGRIFLVNEKTETKTGFHHYEFIGKDIENLKLFQRKPSIEKANSDNEYDIPTKTRGLLKVVFKSSTFELSNKILQLVILEDITEKIQADENYHLLAERTTSGIVIYQQHGIIYANPAMEKISGYSATEMKSISLHFWDFIHPEKLSNSPGNKPEINNNIRRYEVEMITKHGEIKWLDVFENSTYFQGQPATMCIFSDTSDRLRFENDLKKSYSLLEDAHLKVMQAHTLDALVEFASGVAHEIRNPLANISSRAQLSLKTLANDLVNEENMRSIIASTERANLIITELLDFARPQEAPSDMGNINEILENACNHTRMLLKDQAVKLEKQLSPQLPEIRVNEFQLERAFLNLINNGIQAMEPGGTLTVSTFLQTRFIVISIADTGKGIEIQFIDKIFNPFFTMRHKGVGLGLPIVHKIIEYHHGTIEVESVPGKGTKFIIRLPLERNDLTHDFTIVQES